MSGPRSEANYGGSRPLPVHAHVEDPRADLESGLLIRIHIALLGMTEGQILRISSPVSGVTDQLRSFEVASGHALLSVLPDADRPVPNRREAGTDSQSFPGGRTARARQPTSH